MGHSFQYIDLVLDISKLEYQISDFWNRGGCSLLKIFQDWVQIFVQGLRRFLMKNGFILIICSIYLLSDRFVANLTKFKDVSIQNGVTLNVIDKLFCGHFDFLISFKILIIIFLEIDKDIDFIYKYYK